MRSFIIRNKLKINERSSQKVLPRIRYTYSMQEDSHHGGGSALDMGMGGGSGDNDQNRTELTKLEIELCK